MSHPDDAQSELSGVASAAPPAPLWALAALAGLLAAIVFTAWPQLDLAAARLFHLGEQRFLLKGTLAGSLLRNAFYLSFIAFCIVILHGLGRALWQRRATFGLDFPHWLFLLAAVLAGPGLLTNVILKEHWGRARPVQIVDFGGEKPFTPALVPASNCSSNCSFVSGESSSIFMLFFALALILPAHRTRLLLAGVGFGLSAGLMRMGMGGHFLSDVIFSGVFMLLVASSLHWLMLRRFASRFANDGPLHVALAAGVHRAVAALGTLWARFSRRKPFPDK